MLKLIAVTSVSSESSPQALSSAPAATSARTAAIAVEALFPIGGHSIARGDRLTQDSVFARRVRPGGEGEEP